MNPNQVKVKGELACDCCEGTGKAFNAIDCEWACCLYCGGSGRKRGEQMTEKHPDPEAIAALDAYFNDHKSFTRYLVKEHAIAMRRALDAASAHRRAVRDAKKPPHYDPQAPTIRSGIEGAWADTDNIKEAAALDAPREPTEEMLTAARDWSAKFVGQPIGNKAATGCWQAMFDAIPSRLARSPSDLDEARKKIEALEGERRKEICEACGTVSNTGRCDCTAFADTAHLRRPIDYAETMRAIAEAAEAQLSTVTKERDELRDADPVDEWLTERDKRIAAEFQLSARDAEIMELKCYVTAFLAPWAVRYQMDYGLDGLHPVHFDILAKCGARMDGFKRAAIAATVTEKDKSNDH